MMKDKKTNATAGNLLAVLKKNIDAEEKANKKEIEAAEAEAEARREQAEAEQDTAEYDLPAEDDAASEIEEGESDAAADEEAELDALMRKYLSEAEYEKFSKPRQVPEYVEQDGYGQEDESVDEAADAAAEYADEYADEYGTEYDAENGDEYGDEYTADYADNAEAPADEAEAEEAIGAAAYDGYGYDYEDESAAVDPAAAPVPDEGQWNSDDAGREAEYAAAYAEADDEAREYEDGADIEDEYNAEGAFETQIDPETGLPLRDFNGDGVIDETDQKLMVAFGMEEELAQTVGFDKINELVDEAEKAIETDELPAQEPIEFTDREQAKTIIGAYKKKYRLLLLRILGAALLAVAAFFFENISLFGGSLPGALNPAAYPVVYVMAELQIVFFGIALVLPQFKEGFAQIAKRQPGAEAVTVVLSALYVIYHIVLAFIGAFSAAQLSSGLRMFDFPLMIAFIAALISEYFNLKREVYSFNVIASKKPKYVISRLSDAESELERETFAPYLPDDPAIFRIVRSQFVDDFFRRSATKASGRKVFKLVIPAAVGLALIFAVIGFIRGGFYIGVSYGAAALAAAMPVSAYFAFAYPFYRASKEAYKADSAIIGEGALEEYMNASVISFDDKEVFPSYGVKIKSIKVFGDNRIDNVLYNAASLFRAVGGPLSDVFARATKALGHSDEVDVVRAVEGGLEAYVSGAHIFAGRASFLEENGIEPLYDDDDEIMEEDGEVSIMYLVIAGEVAAKLYVQYAIDTDFENTLRQLYKIGMCVGIRTFDPNIDEMMLSRHIRTAKYPVRVLRCSTLADASETIERTESGIVSKNSPKALLSTFALTEKVLGTMKLVSALKLLSMLLGAVILTLLLAVGKTESFTSIYAALYQFFWLIPTVMISRICIGKLQ